MVTYQRPQTASLQKALLASKPFLQVVVGPRQVGKSTAAEQISRSLGWPVIFESADSPRPHPPEWIESQWDRARLKARHGHTLLVLDEIQKIAGWSEVVKRLWDEDCRQEEKVRPLLLGSSALLVQQGLSESLAGRFRLHRFTHWSWSECRDAFGWELDRWLHFGGYPGAASLVTDEGEWKRYINDSLIEMVLGRDVLQLETVRKPALLRQLFALAAAYPAQIFAYNKMLGQLTDAGNTTTLAHYLELLEKAFLLTGLEQFAQGKPRRRGSSPKLTVWNNALVNALSARNFAQARAEGEWWGRVVENAVGAKLLNELQGPAWNIAYWRENGVEMDYVVSHGNSTWGIEVKSGRSGRAPGLAAFRAAFPKSKVWLVGSGGMPLEEFFGLPAEELFQ